MKRGAFCLILAALFSAGGMGLIRGQGAGTVPAGIHYQAVARDAGGELKNKVIDVKFTILSGSEAIYEELHHTTTSQYGVFSLIIGNGEALTGTFSEIDWSTGNHSLQVDIDLGNGWKRMGTMSFMSVPYALYAGKTLLQELSLNGDQLSISGVNKSITIDNNPENELQDLSYNSTTRTLSITRGSSVPLETEVAYRASLSSSTTLPGNEEVKIIFGETGIAPNYNIGGGYNSSSGEFKPPFDGIYTFNVSLELPTNATLILKVDGRDEILINSFNLSGKYLGSITLRLASSNTITVWVKQTNSYPIPLVWGYFSGFRIY